MMLRYLPDITEKHKKKTITYYLTQKEKQQVIKDCNLAAHYLYEYYISHAFSHTALEDDDLVANNTGLSKYQVQRNRIRLTKYNYFSISSATSKTEKIIIYHIGKEAVLSYKFFEQLFGSNYDTVTKVLKKYDNNHSRVYDVIYSANLSKQDTNDLLELFNWMK